MSDLLYLDPCGDDYTTSDILLRWRAYTVNGLDASVVSGGRTGQCIQLGQLGGLSNGLTRNVQAQANKIVCGGAIKYGFGVLTVPNGSKIWSVGNLVGNGYASCSFNASGVPTVYGPGGETLAFDETGWFCHPNVWYYVELVVDISFSGSAGAYTLILDEVSMYVDGRLAATKTGYTSGLTNMGAQYKMGSVSIGGVGADTLIDDVYISNERRWGNARIAIRRPNAEGDLVDFLPSTGSTQYSLIDDTTPDVSDYIYSSNVGDQACSHIQDIVGSNVAIKGLQHVLVLNQDIEGVRGVKTLVKTTGGLHLIPLEHFVNLSPLFYFTPFEFNPDTGLDWTIPEFNAAQFGLEITT